MLSSIFIQIVLHAVEGILINFLLYYSHLLSVSSQVRAYVLPAMGTMLIFPSVLTF